MTTTDKKTDDIKADRPATVAEVRAASRRRLLIGVYLIVASFIIGYPIAALSWVIMADVKIAAYVYLASWIPFVLGFIIGGEPAIEAVKARRRRFFKRRAESE